eukprot:5311009-Amphidinium_carterae.1
MTLHECFFVVGALHCGCSCKTASPSTDARKVYASRSATQEQADNEVHLNVTQHGTLPGQSLEWILPHGWNF